MFFEISKIKAQKDNFWSFILDISRIIWVKEKTLKFFDFSRRDKLIIYKNLAQN